MGKCVVKVGYAMPEEYEPGRWKHVMIEHEYFGETLRNTFEVRTADKVNEDLSLSMDFSLIADPFALQHCGAIRYIEFMGTLWKVTKIEPRYPRIILTAGGVYNGERAQVAE